MDTHNAITGVSCWWRSGWRILVVLIILSGGGAWAQEVAPSSPEPEVEKAPEKKPPPEVRPEAPRYEMAVAPFTPTTSLELGPTIGPLAPYGYAAATDTLRRGWTTHRLGPFGLSPYLELSEVYRSNMFQTYSNKISSFVQGINPGLRAEMPLGKSHKISAGYLGQYFIYSRFTENSHYDHNVNADGSFNFPGGLGLQFGSTYRNAVEEKTATTGRKRPYYRLTPYFLSSYKFADRWKLEGTYSYDNLQFDKPEDHINIFDQHIFGGTLNYKFWPKTSALLQYSATVRDYPYLSSSNNVVQGAMAGLTWDPTAKLSGTVKAGYTVKTYDTHLAGRSDAINSWAMGVNTVFRYSRYTNFTLVAQHSLQDDSDFNNSPYKNTGLFGTLNHEFHYYQIASYLGFAFTNNSYILSSADPITGVLKKRDDNVVTFTGGVSRPFTRWLRLRLDYNYTNKASNFGGYSFNEHRVLFGIQTSI